MRRKLQSADIPVADISTDTAVYKDNPDEWWFVEGAKYVERLKQAWRPASSERLTKEMMEKAMLSPSECEAAVTDPSFATFEVEVAAGRYDKASALISPATIFGKRLTRA